MSELTWRKAARRAKSALYRILTRRSDAYQRVYNSPDGQIVFRDLMRECGYNRQIYCPGDPHETTMRAGQYRIAQHIQGCLNLDEEQAWKLSQQEISDGEDID